MNLEDNIYGDIYDFLFIYRKEVLDECKKRKDDGEEELTVFLPRLIQGQGFYIGDEDDEDAWFCPLILTRATFESMSDREVVSYMRHHEMKVQ